MKTTFSKSSIKAPEWFVVDASGAVLGRLAAEIARRVRGKHKPAYVPHQACGDCIVVVNADQIRLTGAKHQRKVYYWHTGYVGGIKERTAGQLLSGPHPERVLTMAVKRMIPRGPLGRDLMRNLYVYGGPDHPHASQKPQVWDFRAQNRKNG